MMIETPSTSYKNILDSVTDPEDRQFLEDHLLKLIDHWIVPADEGKEEEGTYVRYT